MSLDYYPGNNIYMQGSSYTVTLVMHKIMRPGCFDEPTQWSGRGGHRGNQGQGGAILIQVD